MMQFAFLRAAKMQNVVPSQLFYDALGNSKGMMSQDSHVSHHNSTTAASEEIILIRHRGNADRPKFGKAEEDYNPGYCRSFCMEQCPGVAENFPVQDSKPRIINCSEAN
jgi:hypothetical protein